MKEYLISLYIDDELNLEEKKLFVHTVHGDAGFTQETLAFLAQEQKLRQGCEVNYQLPELPVHPWRQALWRVWDSLWFKPMIGFVCALLLVFAYQGGPSSSVQPPGLKQQRFVVFLPDSEQAQIVGSFTDWLPVPMQRVGQSGYWALTLPVPPGEHRYSYLVDDGRQITDPTVVAKEQDDFGGENSVIEVQVMI